MFIKPRTAFFYAIALAIFVWIASCYEEITQALRSGSTDDLEEVILDPPELPWPKGSGTLDKL